MLAIAATFASQSVAAELSDDDLKYCHYLSLDQAYSEFVTKHRRIDKNDELIRVSPWVLSREQELFMKGHRVWQQLVDAGYLPLTGPLLGPKCP